MSAVKSELCFWFICLSELKKKSFWKMRETVNGRAKESGASCARGRLLVEVRIFAYLRLLFVIIIY